MTPQGRYHIVGITVADPEHFITELINAKLQVWDIQRCEPIKIKAKISHKDYKTLNNIAASTGADLKVLHTRGFLEIFRVLFTRKIFSIGLLLFLLCALTLPTRILFVRIEGNDSIPTRLLLEQARACGIHFGSTRRAVRSENVKNALLEQNEDLQWVGVNTRGCVATIRVKERSFADVIKEDKKVTSIVARHNGVISSVTVLQGTPLCFVGDQVNTGDVLISGYTDCGLKVTANQAIGEVYAHTLRKITTVSPKPTQLDGEQGSKHICYRLKIGKKLINLCNHSGISVVTCDKMYVEEYWTLPGGFQLPVCLIRIVEIDRQPLSPDANEAEAGIWLQEHTKAYLYSQMIAGKVNTEVYNYFSTDDYMCFTGLYTCEEMIGQVKYEETLGHNAEDY